MPHSLHAVIPPAASDVVRHFPPAPARISSQQMRLAQEAPSKEAKIAYLVRCVTHALFFFNAHNPHSVSSGSGKTIRNGLRYRARGALVYFKMLRMRDFKINNAWIGHCVRHESSSLHTMDRAIFRICGTTLCAERTGRPLFSFSSHYDRFGVRHTMYRLVS